MHVFRRLVAVATLAAAATLVCAPTATPARQMSPAAKPAAQASTPSGELLDINRATVDQLKALPGIGDAYAKRITAGRPYTAKNQLVTRGIVPQATYDKIAASIIAHRVSK